MKKRRAQALEHKVQGVEPGLSLRKGWIPFEYESQFRFSTEALRSYGTAAWEEVVFDAMRLCATIEYADATGVRSSSQWARRIALSVPVGDPDRWNTSALLRSLHEALGFLTGDVWSIRFMRRRQQPPTVRRSYLSVDIRATACMPYSSGLDSLAVYEITGRPLGSRFVPVRVQRGKTPRDSARRPFLVIPYSIKKLQRNREASCRARGFKFAFLTGIAAYLTGARRIVVPESGQGVIGIALTPVGHIYPDYRNHPLFARRMQTFLRELFTIDVSFDFPRIWSTKGETVAESLRHSPDMLWRETRSCWRDSRWVSVGGVRRQCGVCAACMLRRISVVAARLHEPRETYVCGNMNASTLESAVPREFVGLNVAFKEHAIGGVLHMESLAEMAEPSARPALEAHASVLGDAMGLEVKVATRRIESLLTRHREEWLAYRSTLHPESFVRRWTRGG